MPQVEGRAAAFSFFVKQKGEREGGRERVIFGTVAGCANANAQIIAHMARDNRYDITGILRLRGRSSFERATFGEKELAEAD